VTDRRTDRRTDGIAIAYARLAYMLSRAKTEYSRFYNKETYITYSIMLK